MARPRDPGRRRWDGRVVPFPALEGAPTLRSVFDDPHIEEIDADDLIGEYPSVEYVPPQGTFHIDILTRRGEAFRFEDLESQRIDFQGILVSVATPKTLYRMKKSTIRLKDKADAFMLKERFQIEDD